MEKLINAIITLLLQSLLYLIKKMLDRLFDGGKTKRGNYDMIPLKWTHEINKRVSMEVGFFYGK
ncbi:hypothetical protein PND92_03420, partial [Faecalicoccus pleomorphus]|uniref:hypothetical protein n=1 Tax=Faecalicoccus pleomorphus TaxID=1323 RepID=UPI00232B22A5